MGFAFDPKRKETPGIEIHTWPLKHGGETVRLHVWDFGGQEILHATHQFFLTERTLYLLVLTGREGKATEDAEELMVADPYALAGLVRYTRTGFNGGARAPGL